MPVRTNRWISRHRKWAAAVGIVAVAAASLLATEVLANRRPALEAASVMSEVIPAGSTPAPDFNLRDQNNRPMSIHAERGKVVLLTFLYSQCHDLCPIEADELARVQSDLGPRSELVFLVVSVAPEVDTSATVRTFARDHHWTVEWHWALAGSRQQFMPVWNAYGVDAVPRPTTDNPTNVAHSGALYLIDAAGYERVGFALNFPSDVIARDIRALEPVQGWRWPWSR